MTRNFLEFANSPKLKHFYFLFTSKHKQTQKRRGFSSVGGASHVVSAQVLPDLERPFCFCCFILLALETGLSFVFLFGRSRQNERDKTRRSNWPRRLSLPRLVRMMTLSMISKQFFFFNTHPIWGKGWIPTKCVPPLNVRSLFSLFCFISSTLKNVVVWIWLWCAYPVIIQPSLLKQRQIADNVL